MFLMFLFMFKFMFMLKHIYVAQVNCNGKREWRTASLPRKVEEV
jgi:hypothetical protein